jgi:hypothetical protein
MLYLFRIIIFNTYKMGNNFKNSLKTPINKAKGVHGELQK